MIIVQIIMIISHHCSNKSKPWLFADDTNLTAAANSVMQDAVISDLENLTKWLAANKLSLKTAKTEFTLICSNCMTRGNR